MKRFAVYSKDKTLLKAFEEKLKEKGIKRNDSMDEDRKEMNFVRKKRQIYYLNVMVIFRLLLPMKWAILDMIKLTN
jgi:hypothetical protein